MSSDEKRARAVRRWRARPDLFFSEVLGFDAWEDEPGRDSQATMARDVPTHRRMACRSGHKTGKLLANETPVPTPSGWRAHGDLRVGDRVFDETGARCSVTATIPWRDRPLMRVTFEDGTFVDADEAHEWLVHTRESRKRTYKAPIIVETRELRERLTVPNGRSPDGSPRRVANFTVDLAGPIQTPHAELALDPYLLGLWLGDGSTAGGGFTGIDGLEAAFVGRGFRVTARGDGVHFHVCGLVPVLRELAVLGDKHVPEDYLWASPAQRLELLRGLMDTDGTCDERHRCTFTNTNERLARSVLHLARSLGLKARIREDRAMLNGVDVGPCWDVGWASPLPVFTIPRKLARLRATWTQKARSHRRMAIVSVDPLPGLHDAQCIEVDSPSHLYLCGESMVPTHNSRFMAAIALWFYEFFVGVRVVMTAPTWPQVDEVVWREIGILWRDCRKRGIDLGGRLYKTADNGVVGPGDRQIFGRATDEPDNFSGISAPLVVYLVDEGSGVDDGIQEAIEGNMAGGAWLITMGNPTQLVGWFNRAFHEESHLWKTYHLSSERTPLARGLPMVDRLGKPVRGLATLEYVAGRKLAWGEDDPRYWIRVKGDFPVAGASSVVSLAALEAAVRRWVREPLLMPGLGMSRLEIGLDCARFGDDKNALCPRRGHWIGDIPTKGSMNSIDVAGWARELILKMRTHREETGQSKRPLVKVDVIGIGAGVYDQLKAIGKDDLEVVPVNVSEEATSTDEPGYTNLRAQISFGVADFLKSGGMLPADSELRSELLAPQYGFDVRGRLKVESKDDIKKRLGRSPDKADAVALAIYEAPVWDGGAFTMKGF